MNETKLSKKMRHKVLWDCEVETHCQIPARNSDMISIKRKELVIYLIFRLSWNRMKIKESEKIDIYLDLAKELEKLDYVKMTVILLVVGALERFPKALKKYRRRNFQPLVNNHVISGWIFVSSLIVCV